MPCLLCRALAVAFTCWAMSGVADAGVLPISPGSWTLAVLPDTQWYSYTANDAPIFNSQTAFLRDHAADLNLKYVLHEGDVVQTGAVAEWDRALTAMNNLNGVVPYAMVTGNHDVGVNGNAANRDSLFNDPAYFGPGSYYATQPSIGGFAQPTKTDSSWHTFTANGQNWLIVNMEWAPTNETLAWASSVIDAHPDYRTMVLTHAYMFSDDTRYDWATKGTTQYANPHQFPPVWLSPPESIVNDGEEIWNKLIRTHDNIDFVFSGHVLAPGTGYRSDLSDGGHPVHQMLANSQDDINLNGPGNMRLLEFKADGTVEVRTYSPYLDQYSQLYTQHFTLQLDQLHGPVVAPPPPLRAIAANLKMNGPTNPTANTISSIGIAQTSPEAFTTPQANRGDFELAVAGKGIKYTDGILLATITQHDRPDFVGREATVEASRNSFGTGNFALSTTEAGVTCCNEVNFDASVAWFRFGAGFRGAHVNNDGNLAPGASNGVTQANVSRTAAGRYNVNLGVNSLTDGMLFTIGNSNSNVVVQTGPLADGSGWDVRTAQSAHEFGTSVGGTSAGAANWSFLYLPFASPGLIGGYYDGEANSTLESAGSFTMNRLSTGQYELLVAGESPESGMLILTVANLKTSGSVTSPDDNFLTYAAAPDGKFLINSYDLPGTSLEDTTFAWAFVGFTNGITPLVLPGDFNRDLKVDQSDYLVWRSQYGATGGSLTADANNDGQVDTSDYVVWRSNVGAPGIGRTAGGGLGIGAVPEPHSGFVFGIAAGGILATWGRGFAIRRANLCLMYAADIAM